MISTKPGRNDPCPCGSGKKYKKCCHEKSRHNLPAQLACKDNLLALQETIQLFPEDAEAHNNFGAALKNIGQLDGASACCYRALEIKPDYAEAHNNLGNIMEALGRLDNAVAHYRHAIRIKPNYAEAYNSLGNALGNLGQLDDAVIYYRRAIKINPDYAEAHNNLGNVLQDLGKPGDAVASYRRALRIKPDYAEAHNNLGNALGNLGRLGSTVECLRRALEIHPDIAETHYNLGITLYEMGRLDEAADSYRRALELKPDYAEAYINLGNILLEQGRLPEAEAVYRRLLKLKPDHVEALGNLAEILRDQGLFPEASKIVSDIITSHSQQDSSAPCAVTPITALLSFGRSGSMFFHSLFDGHPELATLPGIYFKGWFGQDSWKCFAPNLADTGWRELMVEKIIKEFQPLFDARSRKNVIGKPLGNADWLARDSGFMDMGANRHQPFIVDQNAFAAVFLSLLESLPTVSQKVCFELIHRAFEIAICGNTGSGSRENGHIFYHIHNPNVYELVHFLRHYPQARLLHIVRNPVQGMESWMLTALKSWALGGNAEETDTSALLEDAGTTLLFQWDKAVGLVVTMFKQLRSPFNTLAHNKGVRLEDVKRDASRVMPQVAAWMGISDHPSLYEASFCGLQYWGPASKATGKISGFDTRAIDRPVGRLLGSRDVTIFETLFWPFSHLYGYTDLNADSFRQQLAEIRPWLDEPLEFEMRLYAELPDQTSALKDLPPYNRLHRLLLQTWAVLDRDSTYHSMVPPLKLI